jgi:hypothetical protein
MTDSVRDEPLAQCTAILVVHGVQPHARYQIQDECATNLCAQLNDDPFWKTRGPWIADVVQPRTKKDAPLQATISRIHRKDEFAGSSPFFDVVEAYWSPLDKGKTNFARVISWLLRTLIVPLNTTAVYVASAWKTLYDFGFTLTAALLGLGFVLVSLYLVVLAANAVLIQEGCPPAGCVRLDASALWSGTVLKGFDSWTLAALAITAVGGFLLVQALKGFLSLCFHWKASTPAHALKRLALVVVVGIVGYLIMLVGQWIHLDKSPALGVAAWWFVAAAALFELGRTILQGFVVNFFQDVMIYTTRDENSEFFELRAKILGLVGDQLEALCSDEACDGKGYDRVFVLGHSLGSTICLDAIIRFYQRCQQGSSDWNLFQRLRGFVTFGTSLEKTKYFFDVTDPSPCASTDQWRNDVYGVLMTLEPSVLDVLQRTKNTGILWVNYWYFLDVVSNAIDSYRSFLRPGDPLHQASRIRQLIAAKVRPGEAALPTRICRNEKRWRGYVTSEVIPHDEYLRDDRFWRSTRDIVDDDIKKPEEYRIDQLGVLDIVARHGVVATVPFVQPSALPPLDVTFKADGEEGGPTDRVESEAAAGMPIELSDEQIERRIVRVDLLAAPSYRDHYSR